MSHNVVRDMRHILTAAALALAASSALANHEVEHAFKQGIPADGIHRVVIDIPAGDVTVRNGSRNSLVISGKAKREYDGTDRKEKNQKIVDDVSASIYVSNEEAVVRRRFGPNAQGWSADHLTDFHVTIEVPPGTSLDFQTKYGDVTLDGSFGDVSIDLRAGDVNVRTPRAGVRELSASCRVGDVTTNLGHEIIERSGLFPGTTRWEKDSGTSRLKLHVTAGDINVKLTQ
jgi:Toastrack DUF4097